MGGAEVVAKIDPQSPHSIIVLLTIVKKANFNF